MNRITFSILKRGISLAFCIISYSLHAQEGQLTQIFHSTLYLNPAEAGAEKNIRITSNYRRQWTTIGTGFTTKILSADMLMAKFGFGILLSSNEAGAGSLSRTNGMLNLARQMSLNSHNVLGFGMQLGFAQSSVNTSSLKFDNQYSNGTGYNQNAANGENFSSTSVMHLDGGAGMTWQNNARSWQPKVSLSVNHLLQPKQSLLANSNATTLRQYNVYIEVKKGLTDKISLIPYVFYSRQAKANNLQLGSRIAYQTRPDQTLYVGAGARNGDALLTYVGYSLKNILFGFSYDINTSQLNPASKGMGAWELGISLKFNKKTKKGVAELIPLSQEVELAKGAEQADSDSIQPNLTEEKGAAADEVTKKEKEGGEDKAILKKIVSADSKEVKPVPIPYSSIDPKRVKSRYYVYFDSDKSIIKPIYQSGLDKLIQELQSDSSYRFLVSGHTDSDGDGLYNIYLGDARAHEVMKYLVEQGVLMESIQTFTYGKSSPQADNSNTESKAKNRRVEIVLLKR